MKKKKKKRKEQTSEMQKRKEQTSEMYGFVKCRGVFVLHWISSAELTETFCKQLFEINAALP